MTTARRQMSLKGTVCTFQRVEIRISINVVGRAGVRYTKSIETRKRGEKVGMLSLELLH